MATTDRKRQRSSSSDAAVPSKRSATVQSSNETTNLSAVDSELSSINELLQEEETSQKQTWQIGKRVKKLLEGNDKLSISKQLDAYFLWGTALARLASLNEDPTLADAAADKFQQMLQLSQDEADEDAADAALGPVGFSLWGSSLLTVATETQSREVLDQALSKFQRAVEVDGGTTFETRFQFAKALKEGGDLVAFLEEDDDKAKQDYYNRALAVCEKLEEIYKKNSMDEEKVEEEEDREKDEEDEEDDKVTTEDYAEAKLLEAVVRGLLEDSSSVEDFRRTLGLYKEAISLSPGSAEALMEMTNYLAARCLASASLGGKVSIEEWKTLFYDLEEKFKSLLAEAGFDLQECQEICKRKDTNDQEEPEEEEIDERVPHLLNTLGKGLAAFVRAFPTLDESQTKTMKKQKKKKSTGDARFTHAVEVLRSAHHFHDKLGGYYLACLYASPAFEDEEQCRTWLETADSYGALENEFDVQELTTMHEKTWFKRLTQPPEQIEDIDGEQHEVEEDDDE